MENMAEKVNKYIGKPWRSGARGPDEFDCWGLMIHGLTNEFGMNIDEEYYIHGKDTYNVTRAYEKAVKSKFWVKESDPKDGYAVALSKGTKIHHSGIWMENGCLHATDGNHVVHNSLSQLKRNGYTRIEFYKWHKS